MEAVLITHLTKMVSSTMKPALSSSVWETNLGLPVATFMSEVGFLKELLMGSGSNVSTISRPPA